MITRSLIKQVRAAFVMACSMMLAGASLHATTIATYTFAGGNGNPSNVATDTISATTAVSGYTLSGSFGFSSAGTGVWFSRLQNSASNPTFKLPRSLEAATAAGTYLDFTVTPNSGKTVDLTTVDVDVYAQLITGSTHYTYTGWFDLSVTIDGVTTDLGSQSFSVNRTSTGTTSTVTLSYDLSSFADLDSTASFRLTMYLDSDTTTSAYDYYNTLRVDEIRVNAVPEPSTIALSVASGVMLLLGIQTRAFRRRA